MAAAVLVLTALTAGSWARALHALHHLPINPPADRKSTRP